MIVKRLKHGKRFVKYYHQYLLIIIYRVGNLTLCQALTGGALNVVNSQHGEFDQFFSKESNARGFALVGDGRVWI